MFHIFKNHRIKKYLRRVDWYVERYLLPEADACMSESVVDDTKYVISDNSDTPMFSLRGGPSIESGRRQYSLSPKKEENKPNDRIPNAGDHFYPASIRKLFAEAGMDMDFNGCSNSLDSYLNLTFVDMVMRYIEINGWRDSRVYKAAQMDRRLFSKIMSDRNYKPSKDTALALSIGLQLNLDQANDLLSRAGYALSHSNKRDVIIEYFIRERIFNLSDINEVLYRLDQKTIGR